MNNDFIINVKAINPGVSEAGFGTILVLANDIAQELTVIKDLLEVDIDKETRTYKLIEAMLNQKPKPQEILLIGQEEGELVDILEAAREETDDFFFIVTSATETKALMEHVENMEKMLFTTVNTIEDIGEYDNTVAVYHALEDEYPAEALAVVMSYNVGGKTAKFKQLKGVKSSPIGPSDYAKLRKFNLQTYTEIKGVNQITDGKALSGEWIDVVLGKYFVKFLAEERIMKLALQNDKIPFNNRGIGMLAGTIASVMEAARDRGVINSYRIDYKKAEDVPAKEKQQRLYNYLTAHGQLQGAIHGGEININLVYDEVNA